MNENNTFDHEKIIGHYGLEDVDRAFYDWWDKKLNLKLKNKDDEIKKVPVVFYTAERWFKAREVGVRDKNGTLVAPIVTVARTQTNDSTEGPFSRQFADIQGPHAVARQADKKSSLVKNLLEDRAHNIDPDLPIHEIYTVPVPDHFNLTYEVGVWTSYMEDMNEVIQKVGQEFNYKSKKMFKFDLGNGMYFLAFKEDELTDSSNFEDYSDNERIIRKEYVFNVSAHILPESDQRRDTFKRYFSQSKIVIKNESSLSGEELEEYFGKK